MKKTPITTSIVTLPFQGLIRMLFLLCLQLDSQPPAWCSLSCIPGFALLEFGDIGKNGCDIQEHPEVRELRKDT